MAREDAHSRSTRTTLSACLASRPVVGSSARRTEGSARSAQPTAKRLFSPPLIPRCNSSPTREFCTSISPSVCSNASTLSIELPRNLATCCSSAAARRRVSRTVSMAKQCSDCSRKQGSASSGPSSGCLSASSFKSVVLPAPDGPMMPSKWPGVALIRDCSSDKMGLPCTWARMDEYVYDEGSVA